MTRDDFHRALAALASARAEYMLLDEGHPLAVERDAALVAACKLARPRLKLRRKPARGDFLILPERLDLAHAAKVLGQEAFEATCAPFRERAGAESLRFASLVDRLKKEAARVAFDVGAAGLLRRPGAALVLDTTHPSTYGSQGWGAEGYARGSAELSADLARFHDVEVEVCKVEEEHPSLTPHGRPYKSVEFRVLVGLESAVDVELLKRLPGPTMREQVRLSWKRGVNPRVFNPFLPWGYEEREGIDYFGNDLRKKA